MDPADGWVIFMNSQLICGRLGKATLGGGNKAGLFQVTGCSKALPDAWPDLHLLWCGQSAHASRSHDILLYLNRSSRKPDAEALQEMTAH